LFTGLVEARGTLVSRVARGRGARLFIRAPFSPLVLGESIAVDGVCLTVDTMDNTGFFADASFETLDLTTLGRLPTGAHVNLERALPAGGRLGGHFVSGHVDGVGHLDRKESIDDALRLTFRVPPELERYIASKGSITVNGVSLTVNAVFPATFQVAIIPHTEARTGLGGLDVGAPVNLEVDVLARYCERLLGALHHPKSDESMLVALKGAGYL
jgi:riboflavin synthase